MKVKFVLLLITLVCGGALYGQVSVTDQTFRDAKEVKVSSFVPARIVFSNDSIVSTNISIASNAYFRSGNIDHVVYMDNLPIDTTLAIKVKDLKKFRAGQGIQYIEFQGVKAVFQKIGVLSYLTRVLYEDEFSRLSSLMPNDFQILTNATQNKKPYNTYLQFNKGNGFTEQLELIAIFSPSFAPRRSEKAFAKYFEAYPQLVNTIKNKTFLFDAPAVLQLLQDYKKAR
jgi:hypothetical protein